MAGIEDTKATKRGRKPKDGENGGDNNDLIPARIAGIKIADDAAESPSDSEQEHGSHINRTDRSFRNKIQSATGCSERQARYEASIAKAFTEEQLHSIKFLGLNEEQIRRLAAIKDDKERNVALGSMALGKNPDEAIANSKGELAAVRKSVEKEETEAEMSDDAWLAAYCSTVRNRLADTKAYDTSAILYRNGRKFMAVFRKSLDRDARNARLNRAGDPLTSLWFRSITVNHPMEWLICGMCDGSGVDHSKPVQKLGFAAPEALNPKCGACLGSGFKLSFGSTAK